MLDIKTIISAIKFQRKELIAVSLLTLLAGLYVIWSLPGIYVSGSSILVEREGLFSEVEERSGNDNLSPRMHAIVSTVLSTDSITQMLQEHDLVDPAATPEDIHNAIEDFRDDANLEFDNVAIINKYTGKSGMYSQGLNVQYEHENPETAFAVAQSLTNAVFESNKGKGERAVEFRRSFLEKEYDLALQKLNEAKEQVASYKNENALYLPEVHPLAIRRYQEIETQTARVEDNIGQLRRDLSDVRGELATSSADAFVLAADGTRVLGADEQLRLLEAEYARAKSRYSDEHPEVVRLRSELAGLRDYKGGGDVSGIQADIQAAQRRLAAALQRYSNSHPDVLALRRQIAELESQKNAASSRNAPSAPSNASNPAYNRLLIRERAVVDDIAREGQKLTALQEQLGDVKDQLARIPVVEQQLATLTQRQEVAASTYEEIEAELESLSLNYSMQQANVLDRFVLVEAPRKPFAPTKPHKKLLAGVLFMLSMGAGLLVALLLHLLRDRILDSRDIEEIADLPVYMVPRFE